MIGCVGVHDPVHAPRQYRATTSLHSELLITWLHGVCAIVDAYHQLLPTDIRTHLTKPRFTSRLESNQYCHEPRTGAARDVMLLVKAFVSIFCCPCALHQIAQHCLNVYFDCTPSINFCGYFTQCTCLLILMTLRKRWWSRSLSAGGRPPALNDRDALSNVGGYV